MTTFLLIRHALCDPVGTAIAGWTPGVHLNERGRAQGERLAERLSRAPITAVYTSPLERARETAAPVAARLGLEVWVEEALGEIRFGAWTGRTLEELSTAPRWREFNAFRSGTRVPGGELMLEAQTRAVVALDRLRERHGGEMVALVSHGDILKAVIGYYAGIPIDLLERLAVDPASVSVLVVHDRGARLLRLNDTGEPILAEPIVG